MSPGANLNNTQKGRLPGWGYLVLCAWALFFVWILTVTGLSKGVINLLYDLKGSFTKEL